MIRIPLLRWSRVQVVNNACATIAVLNGLFNIPDADVGEQLAQLQEFSNGMDAEVWSFQPARSFSSQRFRELPFQRRAERFSHLQTGSELSITPLYRQARYP